MADLNELNEKVEQIKADIREQLEKIDREHQGCLRVQKDHSRQERYYRRTDEADGFRAQGREG